MTDTRRGDTLPHPWPSARKTRFLLHDLLSATKIDIVHTFRNYNLMTPNARVAELRALGWPVQSTKRPHPNCPGEYYTVYSFDVPFLAWWTSFSDDEKPHPFDYRDNTTAKFRPKDEVS